MKGETGFFLGVCTLAFGYFLSYLYSPDYIDWCINGYNHLAIIGFLFVGFIAIFLIGLYFDYKKQKGGGE